MGGTPSFARVGHCRVRRIPAVLAFLAASLFAHSADASCEPTEGPRFTPLVASRFLKNPGGVLGSDTSDYGLSVFTMQFSAARSRELDVFRAVLTKADRKQRDAIALGFARAVIFCRSADATVSDRIGKWVAQLPMQDVVGAYKQDMTLKDDPDNSQPADVSAPPLEDRFGAGLGIVPTPSVNGVGSLDIPDPTRLPGD